MSRDTFTKKKNDFLEYIKTKDLTQSVFRKFSSEFVSFISKNRDDFYEFGNFINSTKSKNLKESINDLNELISQKKSGYLSAVFVSDWSHTYVGQGEIICLLIDEKTYSGRKKLPDIIFRDDNKKVEVKSYNSGFRLTESTSFFTDLGTIIQALVQGGFLTSLTEINNNELRKGLRHFGESFLCKRGFIELHGNIWKIEKKTENRITFIKSPETKREIIKYSMVRNSLRNWIGRGTLSIKLLNIIDPNRNTRIIKKEIQEYVKNIMGTEDRTPIPLEQYFNLCSISYMIMYDKSMDKPFTVYEEKDLGVFKLERISQAKVTYTKKMID